MREALIILPKSDNYGKKVDVAASTLASALVDMFGGCTLRDARGYWQGGDKLHVENVTEYVVACDDTPHTVAALTSIAKTAGRLAKQEAVYVRYPNGEVNIINLIEQPAQAAA